MGDLTVPSIPLLMQRLYWPQIDTTARQTYRTVIHDGRGPFTSTANAGSSCQIVRNTCRSHTGVLTILFDHETVAVFAVADSSCPVINFCSNPTSTRIGSILINFHSLTKDMDILQDAITLANPTPLPVFPYLAVPLSESFRCFHSIITSSSLTAHLLQGRGYGSARDSTGPLLLVDRQVRFEPRDLQEPHR